ncbi:hypothetical protein DW790_13965 [Firmicutes bacterium AM31-12AC]|nr:hypothetical protein DW790_13965 [Firmicutes bacterium AM31-12AC]
MNESKNVKALKKQLAAAIAMVCVAAVALGSSTYAWFAVNNKVTAEKMSVIASSEVEFLEIQNKGTNFTGGTISVDATKAGNTTNLNLKPVTPFTVADLTAAGSENTNQIAKSSSNSDDGYGDGFIWTWTTAGTGIASTKGTTATWTRADFSGNDKYYLLNNFKFRTTVENVTTDKLYADTVNVAGLDSNALDEAVRILVVGSNGMQIYDVGTSTWTYYNADGAKVEKTAFTGLIDTVNYQETTGEDQAVQVFTYYEGDDAQLYTANINSMKGVTVGITFSVDTNGFK